MILFLLFTSLFQDANCSLQAEKALFSLDQALLEKKVTLTLSTDTNLTCEHAYVDKKKRKITLQKDVYFFDHPHKLLAKCNQAELTFEDKTLSILKLMGNVEIQKEEHLLLYASSITIFPQKDQMVIIGLPSHPVQMYDLRSLSLLTANEIEIFSFLKHGEEKVVAKKGVRGVLSNKNLETIKEKLKHGAFASKKDL